MATTFYPGSSELVTVQHKDSASVAIPHASIIEARYILRNEQGETLMKYRLTTPNATDWERLTAHADDGKFTFIITEQQGKDWKKGKVYLETWIKVTDADLVEGFKPMSEYHLFNVSETNYAAE